jgi:hypothetical protein
MGRRGKSEGFGGLPQKGIHRMRMKERKQSGTVVVKLLEFLKCWRVY